MFSQQRVAVAEGREVCGIRPQLRQVFAAPPKQVDQTPSSSLRLTKHEGNTAETAAHLERIPVVEVLAVVGLRTRLRRRVENRSEEQEACRECSSVFLNKAMAFRVTSKTTALRTRRAEVGRELTTCERVLPFAGEAARDPHG